MIETAEKDDLVVEEIAQAEKDIVTEEEAVKVAEEEVVDVQKEKDEAEEEADIDEDVLEADQTIVLSTLINTKYTEFKTTYETKLAAYEAQEKEIEDGAELE